VHVPDRTLATGWRNILGHREIIEEGKILHNFRDGKVVINPLAERHRSINSGICWLRHRGFRIVRIKCAHVLPRLRAFVSSIPRRILAYKNFTNRKSRACR